MFSFSQLNEMQIILFALILIRMSAFIVSAAIFSSTQISAPLKILLAVTITLAVYHPLATNITLSRISDNQGDLLLLSMREALIGVALGFVTRFFFFAIAMAGELVSLSMGLGQAQIFNPSVGSMGNAMEQFYSVMATLVFLMLNGHHMMIQGVVESFTTSPLAQMTFNYSTLADVVLKMQDYFVIGIKMAAPVMISMMVVQLGMALLSRVVPQINVLVTTASVTVLLGFVIIFISLPLLVMQMSGVIDVSMTDFFRFIKAI